MASFVGADPERHPCRPAENLPLDSDTGGKLAHRTKVSSIDEDQWARRAGHPNFSSSIRISEGLVETILYLSAEDEQSLASTSQLAGLADMNSSRLGHPNN